MRVRSALRHGPVEGYQFGYSPVRFIKPVPVWCYFLHNTLIDTGPRHCQAEVLRTFAQKPIRQILLTHFHEDHSANANALRQQHDCPVRAGALTAQRIARTFPLMAYENFWFGPIDPCPDAEVMPDFIEVGPYRLIPVTTFGHSDDHHVFLEPNEGWLFAGDFYIGNLKVFRRGENIYQMIDSTRAVLQLDFNALFCGHNPVLSNAKAAVQRKLNYLEDIVENVQKAQKRGLTISEMTKAAGLSEQWFVRLFTQHDVGADLIMHSVLNDSP